MHFAKTPNFYPLGIAELQNRNIVIGIIIPFLLYFKRNGLAGSITYTPPLRENANERMRFLLFSVEGYSATNIEICLYRNSDFMLEVICFESVLYVQYISVHEM
jgi:hypothetical protein